MKTRSSVLVALAAWLLISSVTPATAQVAGASPANDSLVGTWQVQVTLRNCSNGNPLGPPFQSLLTFGVGGTLTETTSTSMFFPAERGPGHGVWNRSGGNTYTASSIAYITLNGVLSMKQRIDQRIQIAHDSLSLDSAATIQFFDPGDNLVKAGCATATAQRYR